MRLPTQEEKELLDDYEPNITDLLYSENYTSREEKNRRYDICSQCDRFFKPTRSCKECGCFMHFKAWLKDASCPLGKW